MNTTKSQRIKCKRCKVALPSAHFGKKRSGDFYKYCTQCKEKTKAYQKKRREARRQLGYLYECDQPDCDFRTKHKGNLKQHLADAHDIGATWFLCDQLDCDYKAKQNGHLKRHLADIHAIGVKWFLCDQPDCDYKAKQNSNLKQHLADIHDIDVKWFLCDQSDCDYKTKYNSHLKQHLAFSHDIGVTWFLCDQPDCDYKAKQNSNLKQHLADIHDIDVKWFLCDQSDCDYKTKYNSHLKQHLANRHDIGDHKCDYCLGNRNSSILYTDKALHTVVKICRRCYNKKTGKHSRVELKWSDYLDEKIGTEFLLSSDRSLRSLGGCSLKRPDKLYASQDLVIIGECDEHQHNTCNGNYTCEEQRLSELYDDPSICGKTLVVIRWNPHKYTPPNGQTRKKRSDRLNMYVELHERLCKNPPTDKITVYYMFYDSDNSRICKNLPVKMIYTMND